MLRKFAVTILITFVLTVAVYFLFKGWGRSQASWALIPINASAVLTSDHLQDSVYHPTESPIDLKTLPLVSMAAETIPLLLWVTRDVPVYRRSLRDKTITFSFHERTTDPFGVIMYLPLRNEEEKTWWSHPNRPDTRVLRHTFQGEEITTIHNIKSRPMCSYIIRDEYLILSTYGDLIEDVIRKSGSDTEAFALRDQFKNVNDSRYGLNLYLKNTVWPALLSSVSPEGSPLSHFLSLFPMVQDYHLEQGQEGNIRFSSTGCDKEDNYVNDWLQGQEGRAFDSHRFIPQQTALLFRIASADSIEFRKRFLSWHEDHRTPAWDQLSYYLGRQREDLLASVGNELILCQLEETNRLTEGKLALVKYSNYDTLRPLLNRLARLATSETNVATDKYQGYDLFSIPINELPAGLYGPVFAGFPRTFVTYVAPYLVFSNSSQALRTYISDYENQITWQQSPELDSVLIRRNNFPQLALVASPRKVQNAGEYPAAPSVFSSKVESLVFECHLAQKQVYPSLHLLTTRRRTSDRVVNRTFLSSEMTWNKGHQSFVAIAQNSTEGSTQLLLTDHQNILLRPGPRFNTQVPITRLDGPLADIPYRVDFLNIGRPQLILATYNSLYCIDEDDNGLVTPIKMSLPSDKSITRLFRTEGGSEGSSRFIVLDSENNLFLWDRVNAVPRKINRFRSFEDIQYPITSLNQLGSRSLIITQGNGQLFLMKEDGIVRNGFPVDVLTRLTSAFTLTQNDSTAQPELVGISSYGELMRVDIQGKIVERRQLYRPEASSRYRTLFDDNSLDWLLVRSSDTRVAILSKQGRQLFEIANVLPQATIQYHFFGVDNRFISISSGGFTSLFDMKGNPLGDKPIPSEIPVRVSYQPTYDKLFIFGKTAGTYQVWTIKLR